MSVEATREREEERPLDVEARVEALYLEQSDALHRRVDKMFAALMAAQWIAAIGVALVISPYTWEGTTKLVHVHVYAAIFLGGALSSLPIALVWLRPGWLGTRLVIGVSQMLWSALLIHLTGGRIETHFHVFGSLAFLAFYRDWRVLIPATVVVAADHLVRQMLWPESVYGLLNPEWWRFLEHAWWVVFEDIFLIIACIWGVREMRQMAQRQARVEELTRLEQQKSMALEETLAELNRSQEQLVRTEKLAAVGQLAASVGHELRNPLAAVRNATTWLSRRISDPGANPQALAEDARVRQFLDVIDREMTASNRIISDLLDFARTRPPSRQPCPLRPLVDEIMALVPARPGVKVRNAVPEELVVPRLDRDQFRQILINLVQNAVEAMPEEHPGQVHVEADGGDERPLRIIVADNGPGMPEEVAARIFEPLFTTKAKGTGLGLAVVANAIKGHEGSIEVESELGSGTRFIITLPIVEKAALAGAA